MMIQVQTQLFTYADLGPAFNLNAVPDPDPAPHQSDRNLRPSRSPLGASMALFCAVLQIRITLMRMRIRIIRFILMRNGRKSNTVADKRMKEREAH